MLRCEHITILSGGHGALSTEPTQQAQPAWIFCDVYPREVCDKLLNHRGDVEVALTVKVLSAAQEVGPLNHAKTGMAEQNLQPNGVLHQLNEQVSASLVLLFHIKR